MTNEIESFIRTLLDLDAVDKVRLLECLHCPFYDECSETVEHPIDNDDGSCKTKQQFENKSKGCGNND